MEWYWPAPLCPPQIAHNWTWPSTVTGWELRIWAKAQPSSLCHSFYYPMGCASYTPPPQTLISSLLLWQKENMKYDGTTILVPSHSTVEVQVPYVIMSPQPFFQALGLFHLLRVTCEVVLLHWSFTSAQDASWVVRFMLQLLCPVAGWAAIARQDIWSTEGPLDPATKQTLTL
jgi:hypothetical protein